MKYLLPLLLSIVFIGCSMGKSMTNLESEAAAKSNLKGNLRRLKQNCPLTGKIPNLVGCKHMRKQSQDRLDRTRADHRTLQEYLDLQVELKKVNAVIKKIDEAVNGEKKEDVKTDVVPTA